jgi:tetratricopeptide (TPR) repeat protein
VHNNLAFVFQELGDFKGAAIHHKEAAIWYPEKERKASSIASYVYAYSYSDPFNIGSAPVLQQCIQLLRLALQIDPTNADVLFRLGHYYSDTGQSELSLQLFTELVHHHPDATLGYLNIGNYYYRAFEFKKAEHWFFKLIDLCLTNLQQQQQQQQQLTKLEEGKQTLKHLTMAYSNLGSTYRICDQLPPSLVAYTHAFRYTQFANDFMSLLFPIFHLKSPEPLFPSVFTVYRFIPNLSQINSSPSPYIVSGGDSWALSNIMAVNGLLCNWQHLEILEALVNYVVDTIEAGKYLITQDSKADAAVIDSYSYMLVR